MTVHLPRYIHRTFSKSVAVSEIHNVARYKNARHIWQLRTAGQFCRKFFPFSRAIVIYSMPFLVLSPLSPEEEAEENSGFPCFPCSLYGKSTTGPTPSAGFDKRSKKAKVTIPIAREKGKNLRYLTTARIFFKNLPIPDGMAHRCTQTEAEKERGGGWGGGRGPCSNDSQIDLLLPSSSPSRCS